MPDGDESDAAVTDKRSQTDATPTPTEVPPMVAVYHHETHKLRLRGPGDAEDTFAGVRVNEPVPHGADVDAALLSRPCYEDTQKSTSHFTPFRHSLLSGDKVAPEREATELREWLRGAVQITDPQRLHKRWLTATEPAWLAESAYHRFTSLKYHVLLTGALLHNYRAGHSFNELYLTVDHGDPARGDIEPYRTICTTPVATLTLTGDPGTTPAVPLGPAPAQSFARIWSRLPTHPMDTETVSGWGLVDKRLRDTQAWSTGLQLLEDGTTVDWQPDTTGDTK